MTTDIVLIVTASVLAVVAIVGVAGLYWNSRRDADDGVPMPLPSPVPPEPTPPEVELTASAYSRWLRAQRPPMPWFLGQDEQTQEALAKIGVDHEQDRCIAIGYAIQNPSAVDAALNPTNVDAEAGLLQQIAAATVRKVLGEQRDRAPKPSMAGFSDRREQAAASRQGAKDDRRSFLGRKPSPAMTATESKDHDAEDGA